MMSSMKQLPADTVRLITSSQVITSLFSIVKELVENSLDAKATNIEIKLENYGFDRIEIRDDGSGIPLDNVAYMGQQHFTSKISQLSDLHQLLTYGFRGEALASLCAVASVTIATKTDEDPISMVYSLDHQGKVSSSKPCHLGKGTTVTAVNLFKNTPVRKQFFSSAKRRKDEVRKVEDLLMQFAVIKPHIRFLLRNDKTIILQKNKVANYKAALASVWGRNVIAAMEEMSIAIGNGKADCFLPKPEADLQLISRSTNDRCWVFVNGRPVSYKEIEKIIKHCVRGCHPAQSSGRYPFAFVSISLPPDTIDVNLEPNKTKVLLQEKESILEAIEGKLQEVYHTASKEVHEITNPEVCQSNETGNNVAEYGNDMLGSHRMMTQGSVRQTLPQDHLLDASTDYDSTVLGSNGMMPQGSVRQNLPQEHSIDASTAYSDMLGSSNGMVAQGSVRENFPQEHSIDVSTACHSAGLGSNGMMPQGSINQSFLQTLSPDTSAPVSDSMRLISQGADDQTPLDAHCTLPQRTNNDHHNSVKSVAENSETLRVTDIDKCRSDAMERTLKTNDAAPVKIIGAVPVKIIGAAPVKIIGAAPVEAPLDGGRCDLGDNGEFELLAGDDEFTDSALLDFLEIKSEVTENINLNNSTIEGLIQSANQVAASEWSKGKGLVDTLGRPVEPGKILVPTSKMSNQNPDDSVFPTNQKEGAELLKVERKLQTPCHEKKPIQERMGQATFYNLVGKTPIKRPLTAYIFFSKEMRPKIVKDNPAANFQTIAKLTGERWRELNEDEKKKYEDLMREDVHRYKEQVKEAKEKSNLVQEPVRKKKCIKQPPQQMLVDKLFSSPRRTSAPTTPIVKSVEVCFSFAGLKAEQQNKQRESQEKYHLIGQLSSGFWIFKEGDQLQLLNHYRVEETLLYHRLLAEHRLQIQQLQPPITLSPSMIGGRANWQTLMMVKSHVSTVDGTRTFIDERLVANGFEIKQTKDIESGHVRLQVTGMATIIPCYGLSDLAEILNLIGCSSNSCISLQESRPVKLTHYLQGEAVRLARDLPHQSSQDDISDMMDRQKALLPLNIQSCIHNKPFFQTLYAK